MKTNLKYFQNLQELQIKESHGRAVMAAFVLNSLTRLVMFVIQTFLYRYFFK